MPSKVIKIVASLLPLSREHERQNIRLDGWKRQLQKSKNIFASIIAMVRKAVFLVLLFLLGWDLIMCYHSVPGWTWERWQWMGTPNSPKLHYYWNFTIRLFIVINRTLVEVRGLPFCRDAVSVFYSSSPQPTWLIVVREIMNRIRKTNKATRNKKIKYL